MAHIKLSIIGAALALAGCVENTPVDTPDDRHAGTVYGASGLDAGAYIGTTAGDNKTDVFYEPKHTTPAKVAAAPAKICAYTNQTVVSSQDAPHPTPQYYPTAHMLSVVCKG